MRKVQLILFFLVSIVFFCCQAEKELDPKESHILLIKQYFKELPTQKECMSNTKTKYPSYPELQQAIMTQNRVPLNDNLSDPSSTRFKFPIAFFKELTAEKKMDSITYESFVEGLFGFSYEFSGTEAIPFKNDQTSTFDEQGKNILTYQQFSPLYIYENKAILARNEIHQFEDLPANTFQTFYLFEHVNLKWNLIYKFEY